MALRIISSAQITLSNVFDSFNVVVSNENFSIACDDTGIPLSGEIGQNGKAISSISVYRVNTKLTPVSSNPSANQFSISIANQVNCQGAKKDNDKIYINTLSNGITGKIVVNINIEGNNTVTKEITFSKTLNSLSDLIDGKFIFGLSNWTNAQNGTGDIGSNVKIIDSNLSTYTGKLLEITNEKWFYNKKTIDVKDNKIYEFKIRFKQSIDNTTGGKYSYFGYTPYNSAGNAFGTNGSNNMYLINGEQLSTTSWKEATFYLSKTALPELINDGKVIRPAVRAFPTGTVKFRPMFIVNYQGGNGVALVDYCLIQDVSDKFNIKELDYKTTVLESKNGEINAAVNKIRTFTQLSNNPISLAAKVNYAAYDSPNDGEVYVHGLNSQKKAADIDGSCLWQDNQITLPRQMFNPNGLVPEQTAIFMVRSTADNKWYSVWKDGTTWKRVAADVTTNNTISTFTPSDTTDIFIGYYVTRKSNNQNVETPIDVAQIFTGALDYRQASSMSFASSISQMKIIEDEVSLKSSKDEMLMGVNKWKRTKYRKTLANSSTYPTFNDIANLTPIAQDEVRDSTNLVAGMTGDDHFILHFFTNVFVKSAKNISITGNNVDDTATFFVNGVEAGRINTSETVTMSLKAGWNTLEILFYEHEGGESMNINTNISSLVDNMAYAIGGQSSAITLTPNQIDIMSKNINLTGKVTIDSLSSGMRDMFSTENGKTVIDGGHIKTGSINADNISTGTLNADRLNIGGVINKINADGSHTISGNKVTIDGQGISSVFSTKTELNQKFDNLQIGGRNLIKDSNTTYLDNLAVYAPSFTINYSMENGWRKMSWASGNNLNNEIVHDKWIDIESLGEYTFSILCKTDATSINCAVSWFTSDGHEHVKTIVEKINDGLWKIYSTKNVTKLKRIRVVDLGSFQTNGATYVSFGLPKFEKGNKPTDWTPSPEDADEAIKQAQRTANDANQMFENMASDSKLTPAEKKNTKTEWQNINNEYSRIRQQAINVGVTTTAYDNSYNTLNTYLTNLLSNMNTTSDIDNNYKNNFTNYYNTRQDLLKAISDKLNGKIDNIQIGTRNLLRKDSLEPGNLSGSDGSVIGGSYTNFYRTKDYINIDHTCNYYLKINKAKSGEHIEKIIAYTSDNHFITAPAINKTETLFIPPSNCTKIKFVAILMDAVAPYVENSEIKLEKGNKPTDWTPAPEDITTRLDSAESKITDTAITNTVKKSNTFYTKTDIDAKGYQTATQVQTTANGVLNKFTSSGGYNLIRNSTAACANTSAWKTNASLGYGANDSMGTDSRYYMYLDNGTTTSERFAFSSRFKLKPNTKYTFNGYFHNYTKCPNFDVFVLSSTVNENVNDESYTVVNQLIDAGNTNGAWKYFTATFTTASNIQSGYIRIDNNGYNANGTGDNRVHWNCIQLIEGEVARPWSPHPSEVYDGVTMIDKNGVTVTASNANTKTNMSASGFKITKINNGEDIFRVDQQGLYLKGRLKIESVVDGINKDQLENNLKNDINNAVSNSSNALGQINNLQIGGRNLWKNTREYDGSKYSGWVDNNDGNRITTAPHTTIDGFGVQRIASAWRDMSQRVPIESNTEYTLSAYIKWENTQGEMNFYTNTGTKSGTSVTQQVGTTTYKRVAVTFNSQSGTVSTCRFECTSNTPYLIYGLKLEKGNKPTDWTPAPEDVSNRVEKTEQSISSLQDSIKLKVSQTDIDRSISNIKIGGRNLALGTNCNFTEPYTSFNGGTNTCVSVGKVLTKGLNVDDTVTVRLVYSYENIISADGHQASCWIQGSGNVTNWNAGAFNGSDRFNVSGTGEHTFLYHFTMSSNHIKNEYWDITIRHDYVKSGSIKWKEFKVEKGNKNTDWSPAPEDVDQSILDVYDNTSQLINEVTSNYESAINIMKDSIESTVSETYTTKDDFSTTVESISSKIDQQNDSITASITTATKQLSEDLQDYKDEVTSYMRFDEQGLELGKSNNKFKTRLSNEKLSFIEENQEVAYISNNKMNITDAEIKHQMILGNFAFVPRSNGNMSLKWIRK